MKNFPIVKTVILGALLTVFNLSFVHAQCSISEMTVVDSPCDANDNFDVEINFSFDETGNSGFQVLGNGNNYGIFQYADLPIVIEDLPGNCETVFEFIVRDVEDPTCADFVELGAVCCDNECQLSIVEFETSECENQSFDIHFKLENEFSGENGFSVSINGELYDEFSYADLPLNLEDITSIEEGLNTLMVCDNEFEDCCDEYSFLNPCICGMTNITSNIVDCNSDDTTYYVVINFDHVATNDSFQMGYSNNGTNTFLGTFAYADLPVTAGPIYLSDNEQEILIVDTDNFFCFSSAYLGVVDDCNIECQLYNLFGEAYMCEEGEYLIDFEFDAEDIEGHSFNVSVDGVHYGTFDYGESVYTVGPIPSNCDIAPVLVIEDSNSDSCSDFYNFPEPICCLPDCNFTSLEVTTECGPTTLLVNGEFENNGANLSGFFFVQILGTSYGPIPYNDFTFSIEIPLLANGEYEITVNDGTDPSCFITGSFLAQCDEEPCLIYDVIAEATPCEEGLFWVDLIFEYAGEVSDSFVVGGNGVDYGTFAYGEASYAIGPLTGDCETLYEFVVSDLVFEGCNAFYAFNEAICCENDCEFGSINITDYECINKNLISNFIMNFEFANTPSDSFLLFIDEVEYGIFSYTDLPLHVDEELERIFFIQIFDSKDSICSAALEAELDCSEFECTITDVDIDFIDCDEDENFYAFLDFEHTNTSESFLFVFGTDADTFNYADLPVEIGPLPTGLALIITLIDIEGNCAADDVIFIEDCDTSIDEALFESVKITQDQGAIQIHNHDSQAIQTRLLGINGELLLMSTIESNQKKIIDSRELSSGIYLLHLFNREGQKTVKIAVF